MRVLGKETKKSQENDSVISTLNNLIETCKDGQKGYLTAANGLRNTDLKTLFKTYSRRRAEFAGALQDEVVRLGGKAKDHGSAVGVLHRGWIDLRAAVTNEDEGAVIAECERGEDSTVKTYEDALSSELPEELKTLVKHQYIQVKESYDLIRELERALR
jgi:uncharacterized protein (TIGR02284 family)